MVHIGQEELPMSSRPLSPALNPNASTLRHRAIALRTFAGTIDQLLVTHLADYEPDPSLAAEPAAMEWQLRRRMLERNLHQLHRAADELRDVAHQMWQCADGLELAHTTARASHG